MAFYLKEQSNSFEYYDREILIKALSQLEYGAEESLDRRNNNAIYFNTDPQYDVFTLDEAINKLIRKFVSADKTFSVQLNCKTGRS